LSNLAIFDTSRWVSSLKSSTGYIVDKAYRFFQQVSDIILTITFFLMKTSTATSGCGFLRGSLSTFGAVFLAGVFRFGVSTGTDGSGVSPGKSLFHSAIVTGSV
jgi:hypothetical protein